MDIEINKSRLKNLVPHSEKFADQEFKNFSDLEEILNNIFGSGHQKEFPEDMFRVYENYPLEDNEYFWTMLHGIESIDQYEAALMNSIK